jgi:long-chain-fatty-acid--[acyl-carrier-protein] ligase
MPRFVRFLCWLFGRFLVRLRYRVTVHGKEQLDGLRLGCGRCHKVLILPNHPGYIDPLLVLTSLPPWVRPRPLVFAGTFQNPILRPFMRVLGALEVPDLGRCRQQAREQAENAVKQVIDALNRGENCIFWPSGRLQRDGTERLGGAQALTDVLKAVPDCTIIRVRTRGVWGSMFSFAQTGKLPDLFQCQRKGIRTLLGNLLFFAPRRHVNITLERVDRGKLPELRRDKLNPWFEEWYNADMPKEEPTYVPYHFLSRPGDFKFPPPPGLPGIDLTKIKPETKQAVADILEDKLERSLTDAELQPDTTLDQLGLDSLKRMDVGLAVEQRFGFSGDEAPRTVGEVWALAQGLIENPPPRPPPAAWFRPPSDNGPLEIKGETIAEAFLNRALANPRDVAVADDLAGVVTYERMLVGACVLSRQFAKVGADNVGLLLPASVACDTAFLGLHLAGKLPVVLNWTTGPANLAHAVKATNLTHVVTSKAFLDRQPVAIEGVQFLPLEELHQAIGKRELLKTLLAVRWFPGSIRRALPRATPGQPAVVLFTSGSEKAPKAVPLTHANLLSGQRAGIAVLGMTRADSCLGFLPAFHSFGLSVTGLLPLLGGMRVVRHPDPTDAGRLVRKIAAYKPTVLAGTPTFISYLLDRAKGDELASLRTVVVGAEKCPQSVRDRLAALTKGAKLLEGYGITECSPVVAVNRPEANKPGTVGQPLPGVEVCVVAAVDAEDVEQLKAAALPADQMGMLLVSGPTVFPGYLGQEKEPFVTRDGKRWYITGDLAMIDDAGFIHFCGRLKRFVKVGGEMISLPALEEPFAREYPPEEKKPRVAVEAVEREGGRRVVLFSTLPLSKRDADALLEKEGFRGVMRLDEVRQVEAIPMLGTGKIDYKALRAQI